MAGDPGSVRRQALFGLLPVGALGTRDGSLMCFLWRLQSDLGIIKDARPILFGIFNNGLCLRRNAND